jgi:hypothetical protein
VPCRALLYLAERIVRLYRIVPSGMGTGSKAIVEPLYGAEPLIGNSASVHVKASMRKLIRFKARETEMYR